MANEKRLIKVYDATAVYNGIAFYMAENAYLNDTALDVLKMVASWLNEAPTVDAVEVVRCKDCKHYCQYPKVDKPKACFVHPLTPHFMPEDGFCSNGERKENG